MRVFRAEPREAVALRQGDVEVADKNQPQPSPLQRHTLLQKQPVELALALVARLRRRVPERVAPHVLAPVQRIHVHERPPRLQLEDEHPALRVPVDLARRHDRVRLARVRRDPEVPLPARGAVQRVEERVLWARVVRAIVRGEPERGDPLLVGVAGADFLQAHEVREVVAAEEVAQLSGVASCDDSCACGGSCLGRGELQEGNRCFYIPREDSRWLRR